MKTRRWNLVVILVVAALTCLADQTSKAWVIRNLPPMEPVYPLPFLGDFLAFTYVTNTGVAFGLLRDSSIVLILQVLCVAVAIVVYARQPLIHLSLARLGLGLQLGGALGNLLDRVRLEGHVTDFIDLGVGRYRWFTSNLADVAIVVGVIILIGLMLFEQERPVEKPNPTSPG